MNVALTGANGFLGSYIVKEFLHSGFKVIALVRKSANLEMLPDHSLLSIETLQYQHDLTTQLISLNQKFGQLDYFIHNAGVTVSLDTNEYFRINAHLTQRILDSLVKSEWLPLSNKLIYISSMAAHGPFGVGAPVSNYGRSKREAEEIVKKDLYPNLILRPTGIYGAGDIAFLPLFKLATKGFYPLTSNKQKMSMIHAKDLARMIRHEAENSEGIIHTNDGHTYLHQDFIHALQQVTGKRIRKMPTPPMISKVSLGLSDLWHKITRKRPGLTLEKFQEISMDWHLHENPDLKFSDMACEISLEEGFKNVYNYYKTKNLL